MDFSGSLLPRRCSALPISTRLLCDCRRVWKALVGVPQHRILFGVEIMREVNAFNGGHSHSRTSALRGLALHQQHSLEVRSSVRARGKQRWKAGASESN